jgi:oligopeptide/dipeptide ABC transporter ATP-binding protein
MHKVEIIKIFRGRVLASSSADNTLLDVQELRTSFSTGLQMVHAVDGVSFHIEKGEIFGLVGESGCGKTITSLSVMRLVPPPGRILSGHLMFEGRDLLDLTESEMEKIRGGKIGMVFQEPMTSLNPVFRVGSQIEEAMELHKQYSGKVVREKTLELFRKVGFDEPERKYHQYPHQLSGGQRQRILIAMAISCEPSLVIADEPTTALDVATESQILCLLQELVSELKMSMLFITHDLHIIKSLGQRIGIMYAGRLVEENKVTDFFQKPLHPYSRGLLDSVVWLRGDESRLKTIPGYVPRLSELPEGCKFHPRCPYVMPICSVEEPSMIDTGNGRWVRCYLFQN